MSNTENKQYWSDIIFNFMSLHRLDQKEMAQRLDVSEATLSGWLKPDGHGISKKNAERIKFICRDVLAIQNVQVQGDGNRVNSSNINNSDTDSAVEKFRRNAMDAVMFAENLSAEAKAIVYLILKNLEC